MSIYIYKDSGGSFNNCIYLYNNYLAISDDGYILIWLKNNNWKKYSNINLISAGETIFNLLLANRNYFVFGTKHKLEFVNIQNLRITKTISKLDIINSKNAFLLFKDYIIINCNGGFAIVSVNKKKLVQYIQNFNDCNYKAICKINNDVICI